jgi:polar amino acid transport system substrate-binding protein
MKARLGIVILTGGALLFGAAGCANPQNAASNVKAADVGTAIAVAKDDKIAAMVPEEIRQKGSFTASINPDVAPVKFVDSNGNLAGLVPDLLNDAATVMGIKLDLQRGTFDSMVPGLESKRFDVVASIGDFKERQTHIDFIDYLQTGTAVLTSASFEKDKITPADLCGLNVAYARGTAQQGLIGTASTACEAAGKKAVNGTGYGDAASALLSVKSAQADAFWGDSPSMLYNAKTSPTLYKVVYEEKIGPYGIGVNKENKQFTEALRSALLKLVSTGGYDQLLEKWGQQDYGMPEMPLNTGPNLKK